LPISREVIGFPDATSPRHHPPLADEKLAHDAEEVLEVLQPGQARLDVILLHRGGDAKRLGSR
jgi:hypothetical protein